MGKSTNTSAVVDIMNKKVSDKRLNILQEKNIPIEVLAYYQKVRNQINHRG